MLKRKILYIALGLLTQDYWASEGKLLPKTEVLQQTESTQTDPIFLEGDSIESNEIMQKNTPCEQICIDNYNKFCESIQKLPKYKQNELKLFVLQYSAEQKGGKKGIETETDIDTENNINDNTIKVSDTQYAALQGAISSLIDYDTPPETAKVKEIIDTLNDLADIRNNPLVKDDIDFCVGVLFYQEQYRDGARKLLDKKSYENYTPESALQLIKTLKNNLHARYFLENLLEKL